MRQAIPSYEGEPLLTPKVERLILWLETAPAIGGLREWADVYLLLRAEAQHELSRYPSYSTKLGQALAKDPAMDWVWDYVEVRCWPKVVKARRNATVV